MKKQTTLSLTQTALMTALIAVSAQIALPFFAIPLTLQTFAVCLAGFLFGAHRGLIAVSLYLILGACGMPVFAGFQGSFGILLGPTGGFLIGFLPLAFFCGISQKSKLLCVIVPLVGLSICHLFGVLWFSWQSGNGLLPAFFLSSAPYIIKDMLSCIAAKLLAKRLFRIAKGKIFNKN
jgi:biotin transport system substrate-specific component